MKWSHNTDDSLWLVLPATDQIMNLLDNTLKLYDHIEDNGHDKKLSLLKNLLNKKDTRFNIEKDGCIIYVLISEKEIDLIIRKTGNYQKLIDKLTI